jgi:murein DD-endopeptidase MepM/ murein hydrolase activator NlpD
LTQPDASEVAVFEVQLRKRPPTSNLRWMRSFAAKPVGLITALVIACSISLAGAAAANAEGGAAPGDAPAPVVKPKPKTKTGGGVIPGQSKPHLKAKPKPKAKPKKKPKSKKNPKLKPKPKAKPHAKPKPKPKVSPTQASGVFPVRGSHTFGGTDARFGAGRVGHTHQGQDLTGAEGTPIVCPVSGTITYTSYQADGAGYYFVLRGSADNRDYVFMHLVKGSLQVKEGDTVKAGQPCAQLGNTGRSSGPHLHFEIWVGGWYEKGGHPIDPLPQLKAWDRVS